MIIEYLIALLKTKSSLTVDDSKYVLREIHQSALLGIEKSEKILKAKESENIDLSGAARMRWALTTNNELINF